MAQGDALLQFFSAQADFHLSELSSHGVVGAKSPRSVMKKPAPITQEELVAISESVDRAWQKLARKYSRGANVVQTADGERFFSAVSAGESKLAEPFAHSLIQRALKNNDSMFFIRLGRALESLPSLQRFSQMQIRLLKPIETFFISHWAEAKDGFPALYTLTPEHLTLVLSEVTGNEGLETEAVVKMRQRLGLKPFRRKQFVAFWKQGKLCFHKVDK